MPTIKIALASDDAVLPSKASPEDSGYDLTIIKKCGEFGEFTTLYDTGVMVQPEDGYYTEVVPRSNFVKSGHVLANSVGIIDSKYRGTIKIAVTKVDQSLPDLPLPYKGFQLLPRQFIHMEIKQVSSLDNTSRGANGFGSTGGGL